MTRAQLIKVINVGRAQLGWDDDLYRSTLARFGGQPDADGRVSLKTLDGVQMTALLAHMRSAGFSNNKGQPHNLGVRARAELTKIEALLTDSGKPWGYADAILKTQTRGRKQRIAFANEEELKAVLAALERHSLRQLSGALSDALKAEGWTWHDAGIAAELLFGFQQRRRDLTKYTEMMSSVLRWLRGELAPFTPWPRRR